MKVATISSVIGDFTGEILLIAGVGIIAAIALKLGPPELFAVYFAAFVVIGAVIGKSIVKGLAAAALGVLVKTIGIDPITTSERFTFGSYELQNGISLVPLMIGIFVLGEVFTQIESKNAEVEQFDDPDTAEARIRNRLTWAEYKPCRPHVVFSQVWAQPSPPSLRMGTANAGRRTPSNGVRELWKA